MSSDIEPGGEPGGTATTLIFTYRLMGEDAEATIADGTQSVSLRVWHVTDALGDLLRCVNQLLEGYELAWCVWQDDPGAHKWLFTRHGALVRIRILQFPNSFPGYGAPDEWATPVFETARPLLKLANKVRNEVRRLATLLTAEQYRNQTGHEFPRESFETLRRLIQGYRADESTSWP